MEQSVFADVKIAGAGRAAPLVFLAMRDVVLKVIELSVAAAPELLGLEENRALLVRERLKLTAAIVNDADRRAESKLNRPPSHNQCALRIAHSSPDHLVHVNME